MLDFQCRVLLVLGFSFRFLWREELKKGNHSIWKKKTKKTKNSEKKSKKKFEFEFEIFDFTYALLQRLFQSLSLVAIDWIFLDTHGKIASVARSTKAKIEIQSSSGRNESKASLCIMRGSLEEGEEERRRAFSCSCSSSTTLCWSIVLFFIFWFFWFIVRERQQSK